MGRWLRWLGWIGCALLVACAPPMEPDVRAVPDRPLIGLRRCAIVPLDSRIRPAWEGEEYGDARFVVRDHLAEAFSEALGLQFPPAARIDSVFTAVTVDGVGVTEREALRIGEILGVDVIVTGRLDSYSRGSFFGPSTSVKFALEARDVANGRIVWSARWEKTAAQGDPSILAREMAGTVAQALKRLPGFSRESPWAQSGQDSGV